MLHGFIFCAIQLALLHVSLISDAIKTSSSPNTSAEMLSSRQLVPTKRTENVAAKIPANEQRQNVSMRRFWLEQQPSCQASSEVLFCSPLSPPQIHKAMSAKVNGRFRHKTSWRCFILKRTSDNFMLLAHHT